MGTELFLAYDWAARESMHAAGYPVERRDRPSCLELADVVSSVTEAISEGGSAIASVLRDRLTKIRRECVASTHRITVTVVVRLPPGREPPTPTSEAADAAAYAVVQPPFDVVERSVDIVPIVLRSSRSRSEARPRRSRRRATAVDK